MGAARAGGLAVDLNAAGSYYFDFSHDEKSGSHRVVNLKFGKEWPHWAVYGWVRNLFEDDNPTAAFRDIYWTNDSDLQAQANPATIREASTFDDFPPLKYSVTYPSLRTFGLIGKVRFGGAER